MCECVSVCFVSVVLCLSKQGGLVGWLQPLVIPVIVQVVVNY